MHGENKRAEEGVGGDGEIMKNKIRCLIFSAVLIIGCGSKKERIIINDWKWVKGCHVDDVIYFDESGSKGYYTIDSDCKIYSEGRYVAYVEKVTIRKLILSCESGEKGVYVKRNMRNAW